ncbi:MAG: hypothetical protein LW688_01740 [Cryomorphaceae bacterium]|jgi:hypothetical protein|nr:hypothetical protein [Cryomorphaceae bacterium]
MKIRIIYATLIILLSTACRKNSNNPVPSIPFDITIDINLPSYSALMGVGGWTYVYGGSKGIIVYRRSIDEFIAFDRHSPADPEGICGQPLYPDSLNFLQLNDSCSGATFSLYDGSPINGSEYGLRQYQTVYGGANLLRIYN